MKTKKKKHHMRERRKFEEWEDKVIIKLYSDWLNSIPISDNPDYKREVEP